ncbi:MAG: hypothetical protein ACRENI_02225 [Gemmatimonadaceae bacterium]
MRRLTMYSHVPLLLVISFMLPGCARAPEPAPGSHAHGVEAERSAQADVSHAHGEPAAAAASGAMSGPIDMGAHMRLSPVRAGTAEDSARAARVVAELRSAIAKYRDVRVAEDDGFAMFAPGIKGQRTYHFTNNRNAFREHLRFDPAKPTSLLYEKGGDGEMNLIGAMYVAPKRASMDDLDARVPLSLARWHAHVNICLPGRGEQARWLERRDGKPVFGPAGVVATEAECDAVDGRFQEQLFGWMVHANVFAGDDHAAIWGHVPGQDDQAGMVGNGGGGHHH